MRTGMERLIAEIRGRFSRHAERQKHLAVQRALAHHVVAIVGAEDSLVRRDVQPMGTLEYAFTPRAQKRPLAIEHRHWVLAATEDVHPVLGVHGDGRHLAEAPAVRQPRPVGLEPVFELAFAQDYRHASPTCLFTAADYGSALPPIPSEARGGPCEMSIVRASYALT